MSVGWLWIIEQSDAGCCDTRPSWTNAFHGRLSRRTALGRWMELMCAWPMFGPTPPSRGYAGE